MTTESPSCDLSSGVSVVPIMGNIVCTDEPLAPEQAAEFLALVHRVLAPVRQHPVALPLRLPPAPEPA